MSKIEIKPASTDPFVTELVANLTTIVEEMKFDQTQAASDTAKLEQLYERTKQVNDKADVKVALATSELEYYLAEQKAELTRTSLHETRLAVQAAHYEQESPTPLNILDQLSSQKLGEE